MPTTITHSTFSSADGGDYLDEFRVKKGIQISERAGRDGEIAKVKPFRTINEFSWKGGGDPAIALGTGSFTITGLTGGVKVIQDYEHTEHNDNFDEFTSSGKHYPSGAAA